MKRDNQILRNQQKVRQGASNPTYFTLILVIKVDLYESDKHQYKDTSVPSMVTEW